MKLETGVYNLSGSPAGLVAPTAIEDEDKLQSVASLSWPSLTVTGLVIPEKKVAEGILVKSTSALWVEIVEKLGKDWNEAYSIPPDKWEELIAGAFKKQGYDEVTLTPHSNDKGRDVIAIKHGVGSVKILGSVKAYKPHVKVPYDAIRGLLGVLASEHDASKGIITTTSTFPPNVMKDKLIAPHIPHRLELMDGEKLRDWLLQLNKK